MGWGQFLGKLSTFIPSRIEQLKNEKTRLLDERKIITSKVYSPSGSRRVIALDKRVQEIDNILGNAAKD